MGGAGQTKYARVQPLNYPSTQLLELHMSFILENSIGFFGCSHYCYKGTYKIISQHIMEEMPKKCFISAVSHDALLVGKTSIEKISC